MIRNLVTSRFDNLLILRQNKEDPTDQEWDDCMRALSTRRSPQERVSVLVVTDGGSPTPKQRKQLSDRLKSISAHVAVCTDSVRTRFIVSSVALFTSKIRAFSLSELNAAFEHLKLSAAERTQVRRRLDRMTQDVGGSQI